MIATAGGETAFFTLRLARMPDPGPAGARAWGRAT